MKTLRPVALTPAELVVFKLVIEHGSVVAERLAALQTWSLQYSRGMLRTLHERGYLDRSQAGRRRYSYTPNADAVGKHKNPLGVPDLEQVLTEHATT